MKDTYHLPVQKCNVSFAFTEKATHYYFLIYAILFLLRYRTENKALISKVRINSVMIVENYTLTTIIPLKNHNISHYSIKFEIYTEKLG